MLLASPQIEHTTRYVVLKCDLPMPSVLFTGTSLTPSWAVLQTLYTSHFIHTIARTPPSLRSAIDLSKVSTSLASIPAMRLLDMSELHEVAREATVQEHAPGVVMMRQGVCHKNSYL